MNYKVMSICGNQIIINDNWHIPADPANTDYQQYLAWLAEGNTPEEWNPDAN